MVLAPCYDALEIVRFIIIIIIIIIIITIIAITVLRTYHVLNTLDSHAMLWLYAGC